MCGEVGAEGRDELGVGFLGGVAADAGAGIEEVGGGEDELHGVVVVGQVERIGMARGIRTPMDNGDAQWRLVIRNGEE